MFAASGSKKKGGGRWSLKDFLPQRRSAAERARARTPEDLLAMATHLNAMMGGRDLRPKGTKDAERLVR